MVIGSGYAMTDMSGRFVDADELFCTAVGYSLSELATIDILTLTAVADRERNRALIADLEITGQPFVIAKRYERRDGGWAWSNNVVSKVTTADGKPRLLAKCQFFRLDEPSVDDAADRKGRQQRLGALARRAAEMRRGR